MLRAEWVTAPDTDSITEDQILSCIEMRSRIDPADYDLAQIEKGIQHVRLSNGHRSLEMKIWELDLQYAIVLENLGNTDFTEKQPELAVKHILKRITHEQVIKKNIANLQATQGRIEGKLCEVSARNSQEGTRNRQARGCIILSAHPRGVARAFGVRRRKMSDDEAN